MSDNLLFYHVYTWLSSKKYQIPVDYASHFTAVYGEAISGVSGVVPAQSSSPVVVQI